MRKTATRAEFLRSSVSMSCRSLDLVAVAACVKTCSVQPGDTTPLAVTPPSPPAPACHSRTHTLTHSLTLRDLSPHSLSSLCVFVCPKCPVPLHTWSNAVNPLAACGILSASGSCWSSGSGLETVAPPSTPTPPSFHRTAAWTAYSR